MEEGSVLNPYFIIGALGLLFASNVGTFFYKGHLDKIEYDGAIAKQNAEAEHLRAEIVSANSIKAAQAAEFARNLDESNSNAQRQIADAGNAARREYAERLHVIAASRSRCPGPGSAETADPSIHKDANPSGNAQLLRESASILGQLIEGAESMKATLSACRAWALEHGR